MSSTPSPSPSPGPAPLESADAPAAEQGARVPSEQPAPKSPYGRMTKKDTSVRNIAWALAVIMGFVVVLALLFFGVGNDPDRSIPETSQLNVAESAERAAALAPFPVVEPELGEQWTPRYAQFSDGASPRWELRYSSPSGKLVTVIETEQVEAPLLSAVLPGAVVEGELSIEGVACQQLRGSGAEAAGTSALSCETPEWAILVHGDTDPAELETVARAAILSARS
ncbi:DUF4245 family protein [Brachybacterium hainanense]|uniref:DUF4245 family protein n=1 Tax=Brachybacterium hainanense TaxID=1541174 RepID=A0ABV6R7R5_9MICO